jgi:hypothetical protein
MEAVRTCAAEHEPSIAGAFSVGEADERLRKKLRLGPGRTG